MVAALRLADLLASLSLVSDLGYALPPGESIRACVIGTALARRMGLGEAEVADVFYTALLQHVGCTGFAHETSAVFGDELVFNAAVARTDFNDVGDVVNNLIRATTRGRHPVDAARVALYTVVRGSKFGRRFATATCEVGRETARRLGLPDGVRRGLHEVVEAWNGKEGAQGLRGEDISVGARIASAAWTAARFDDIGGEEAAVEALRRRAGGTLDPAVVAVFTEHSSEILGEVHARDPRDTMLAVEPAPVHSIIDARLPDVAAAFADVADLKSTFTLGHSIGVADLASQVAVNLGLDPVRVRVAALLHDLGRVGISNSIWERRPGP